MKGEGHGQSLPVLRSEVERGRVRVNQAVATSEVELRGQLDIFKLVNLNRA
jgi:hypothetical protein